MHRISRTGAALLGAIIWVGTTGAWAVDDRFDPDKTPKGGFAPAHSAEYAKECGACHFTYLPGMLPARSWKALLESKDHFGETLGLAPQAQREIQEYLVANAADHSDYRGSEMILWWLDASSTPVRITALPLMRQRHVVIRKLMSDTNLPVKSLTNCDSCHLHADTGAFSYDRINVPGLTRKPWGG